MRTLGAWMVLTWRREAASTVLSGVILGTGLSIALLSPSDAWLDLVFQVALWGTIAIAWNIIGGFGGQLSLGHSSFYGLGAYAAALLLLRCGISPIIGALAGVVLAIALALLVGLAGLRLRGPFFAMATFVMGPALQTIATNLTGFTGGSGGLSLPLHGDWTMLIFASRRVYVLIALAFLTVALLLAYRLRYTATGMCLISAGNDPAVAGSLGINVLAVRLGGMALSAALTAICGTLATVYTLFIDPENAFGAALSIRAVTVAIIGGTGTVAGPLLGAVTLIPMEQFLSNSLVGILPGLSSVLVGLLLVFVVVVVPGGLAKGLEALRVKFGPRSAPKRAEVAAP